MSTEKPPRRCIFQGTTVVVVEEGEYLAFSPRGQLLTSPPSTFELLLPAANIVSVDLLPLPEGFAQLTFRGAFHRVNRPRTVAFAPLSMADAVNVVGLVHARLGLPRRPRCILPHELTSSGPDALHWNDYVRFVGVQSEHQVHFEAADFSGCRLELDDPNLRIWNERTPGIRYAVTGFFDPPAQGSVLGFRGPVIHVTEISPEPDGGPEHEMAFESAVLPLYHPAFRAPVPTCADLLSRCDAGATRLITAARALAQDRITREDELLAAPIAEPMTHRARSDMGLTRTDLLRAVLGRAPDALRASAFDGPIHIAECRLGEAVQRWARAVDLAQGSSVTRLERGWARRLSMIVGTEPELRIDVPFVLSLVLDERCLEALTAFRDEYVEGLLTAEEAAGAIRSNLAENLFGYSLWTTTDAQGRWVPMVPTWYEDRAGRVRAAKVPTAYFDRHGGLAQLDAALTESGAVVLVAEQPGHGRRSLAEAWLSRLRFIRQPAHLAELRCAHAPYRPDITKAADALQSAGVVDASAYILAAGSGRGGRARVGDFTAEQLAGELRRIRTHREELRAIFVVTGAEYDILCRRVAGMVDLPGVWVPPLTDRDLLVLWLCKATEMEDRFGDTIRAGSVVRAFVQSSEEERRDLDIAHIRDACRLSRNRALSGWLPTEISWHQLSQLAERQCLFHDPSIDQSFVHRYIGDMSHYGLIASLDEWLRGE